MQKDDPFVLLGTEMRRRRSEAGLSQERLAVRIGADQAQISKAETGRKLPSAALVEAMDDTLAADGALLELYAAAKRARQATTETYRVWVDGTDRRQFLGGIAAASVFAATTYQRISSSQAGGLTLVELEEDADEIALSYASAPHAELLPRVIDRWQQVEAILDGRAGPVTRAKVTLLGGQFTYFLGRLAFNTGDFRVCRRFATLSGHYAGEVQEPVLSASVVALHASVAYWTGHYRRSLDHLRECEYAGHPYIAARIAAYEARAWARLGDRSAALKALERMDAAAGVFRPLPGDTPVGDAAAAMFRSGVAVHLGDASQAARWAPIAVAAYSRPGPDHSVEEAMHARVNLAISHLVGDSTDLDGALAEGRTLIEDLVRSPTHTMHARMNQLIDAFTPAQREAPSTRGFIEQVRVLPAGSRA